MDGRKIRLLGARRTNESYRLRYVPVAGFRVRRVTVSAADVVAPVFAATKIIAFLFAGMAGQTGFRNLFG